jgi:hypothetical protein
MGRILRVGIPENERNAANTQQGIGAKKIRRVNGSKNQIVAPVSCQAG